MGCREQRELFKKLFVVLFLDVSFGDGMREAVCYSAADYVISIKRLKIEDWRIMICIFKGCKN